MAEGYFCCSVHLGGGEPVISGITMSACLLAYDVNTELFVIKSDVMIQDYMARLRL